MLFQGNDYFTGAAPVQIAWGNSTYSALASWRSATAQEMLSGADVGQNVDPKLVSPGAGGTPAQLSAMTAYELQSGSPVRGAGLNLAADFGVSPGPIDFWGNPVPANGPLSIGAYQ